MIFLCGKLLDFIVLDKTYAIPVDIHTPMVTDAGNKAKYEANAKVVDHLVRSLCDPEFERVRHLNLAWQIWEKLLVAHGGDNHVKLASLFLTGCNMRTLLNFPVRTLMRCFRGSPPS
jgi:hypothetical protein